MTSIAIELPDHPSPAQRMRVAREAVSVPSTPAVAAWLPAGGERELRLDLFRGLALWLIFIDHLPPNLLTWFTIRNYGFKRRYRDLHFHFGLHRGVRVRPRHAAVRIRWWRTRASCGGSGRSMSRTCSCSRSSWRRFPTSPPVSRTRYIRKEMGIMDFLKQPDVTIIQVTACERRPTCQRHVGPTSQSAADQRCRAQQVRCDGRNAPQQRLDDGDIRLLEEIHDPHFFRI